MSELSVIIVYVLSIEIVCIDSCCYTPIWIKKMYQIVVVLWILRGFNRQLTVQASVDCFIAKYSAPHANISYLGYPFLLKLLHVVRSYDLHIKQMPMLWTIKEKVHLYLFLNNRSHGSWSHLVICEYSNENTKNIRYILYLWELLIVKHKYKLSSYFFR